VAEGFLYTTRNVGIPDPVTGKLSGFEVFDVMDPANPIRVGRESAIGEVIELAGKLAYVAQPGMTVVDISDPTAPRRRGSIGSDSLKDVAVYGDHAYLAGAGGLDGLKVVDLSVLDTPAEVGAAAVAEFYPYDRPSDIAVSGGIAYLTVGDPSGSGSPSGSLRTFDVANPSEPVALASIDTAGAALDVELDAGLAYVAADRDGLRIFDVSEPSAPTAVGGLALPGSAAKVAVSGEIAYVVNRGIRLEEPIALRVLDISEPSAPIELGAVELADRRLFCRTPGLAVVDQLVYVNCAGLQVVDVSDPAHPVSIYTRPRIGSDSSIQVEDGLAYMVADGLLSVFDVSDPALPILLDTVYSAGDAAIVVQDGFAYSAGSRGLVVHDLSDPRAPVWLGGYPSDRGPWRGLAIADGLVFGAAGRDLQIIDLGPEYAHTLPVEIAIRADGASAGVNLASRGVIPVTVLGAADFDVANIERSTLRFGPGSATPAHPSGGHLADVNGDGHPDLVSHYWIGDSGISADDESACISGQTSAGKSFKGCGPLQATLPRGQSEITNVAD